ncbi:hypothetical protein ThrDRAFT_00721 [Frankia casuarinae]|jgi:tyrosinase|uniref:Tyrosinase n=2 Tax=Frankia casuarinae (strain DSM 45818 / CECT 9043 / HFP020203 / CcI3) TaxID=106370 RepID=Q2JGG6_FRACC|nr:tyrosinase family protein [Frankia casuarinae]ABD09626.1 tyrosinase [Frankia casuarinae]EYT93659.1 hypothetical protein ThrDRAFT_00721 [Frankia casuarinae]
MAVVRRDILLDDDARKAYIRGIKLLKHEPTTLRTNQFGIPGPSRPVRTYDLFVIWHVIAMNTPVPPGGSPSNRNAAHAGPVFLPWHRVMLGWLEVHLQRVLGDPNFGLPYWDWARDGTPSAPATAPNPAASALWRNTPDGFGGQGTPIPGGAFFFDPADPTSFRVRISTSSSGALQQVVERGVRRRFGSATFGSSILPSNADITAAFDTVADPTLASYDEAPFNVSSRGFRNRLEGFIGTGLHNQVHRWVGGGRDMSLASSPNDPVFFVHHCNVDRVWEGWMRRHGRVYQPDMTAPASLLGHRIDDPLVSPFAPSSTSSTPSTPATPRSVLDMTDTYTYDVLP